MGELGEGSPELIRPPFFRNLDLGNAVFREEALDTIVALLQRDGTYSPDLLYRGFNGEREAVVRKHGTDVPDRPFSVITEEEWRERISAGGELMKEPFEYALSYEKPAISIYRRDFLVQEGFYEFRIPPGVNHKKALVGMFRLKNMQF